jgi:hypothetical protein
MFEFEEEFHTILSSFNRSGALTHLVLIGSWVLLIYRENYNIGNFQFTTSDVDFSIARPHDSSKVSSPSIHKTLTQLGYVPHFSIIDNAEKYIPAWQPAGNDLCIEFLCDPGRHTKKPYKVKGLGIATTPVTYQRVLVQNAETLNYRGIPVTVPQPGIWAIHKIAISQLRKGKNSHLKMIKDLKGAQVIINFFGEEEILEISKKFRGKFLKLFQKGWDILTNRDSFKEYIP